MSELELGGGLAVGDGGPGDGGGAVRGRVRGRRSRAAGAGAAAVAAGLALALAAVPARAMYGDDTLVVAPKHVEIELRTDQTERGGDVATVVSLAGTAGLAANLDVELRLPYIFWFPDDALDEAGPGDVRARLKFRFRDGAGAAPSLAATLGVSLPTGDEDEGLGSGEIDMSAGLVAGIPVEPVTVYLNAVYRRLNGADEALGEKPDVFGASAAVEWALAAPVWLSGELLYETARADGEDDAVSAAASAKYGFAEMVWVEAGGRLGFTDSAPDWGLYATLTFLLGLEQPVW